MARWRFGVVRYGGDSDALVLLENALSHVLGGRPAIMAYAAARVSMASVDLRMLLEVPQCKLLFVLVQQIQVPATVVI